MNYKITEVEISTGSEKDHSPKRFLFRNDALNELESLKRDKGSSVLTKIANGEFTFMTTPGERKITLRVDSID